MKTTIARAELVAEKLKQITANDYAWIARASVADLREFRPLLALGGGPDGAARMLREAGGFLDPRRGGFTTTMNLPMACAPGQFVRRCREAVARIDARMAGTKANLTAPAPLPAAKAAPVATKEPAPAPKAKELFGLERVVAALNAELTLNRKK